jgi:DegV family protein with EDD domain
MTVAVVTDSSAVVPARRIKELSLRMVPLDIAWPDGTVEPGDLPYTAIAERLARAATPPRTGAPSPGLYLEILAKLLASHDGVLVVCPSSELSTTYASAVLGARELGDERVRVLDARTAAGGQGLVALEAARAALDGGDLTVVCDRSVFVASRVQIWATLAQLDFLRRSGRLPAIAAIGAGALGLQPVVRYAGSSPAPVAVSRSEARAADRIFRAWKRTLAPHAPMHAIAFHSDRARDAEGLVARVVELMPEADVESVEVQASLAAHTGPGLLGLAWFWDN